MGGACIGRQNSTVLQDGWTFPPVQWLSECISSSVRKWIRFALKLQVEDPEKVSDLVSKKEEVAAEMEKWSAAIKKAMKYDIYMYGKPVNSTLKNNTLYN